ncbi:hypothetical protein C8R46DRAFT_1283743 [Mycena filopes]|nr:hypothetical protein C8R46DRAFT_1283743 [Mycena filopes]
MMQLLTENFGAFQSVMANYVQGQANAAAPASTAHTVPNPSAPRGTARVRDPRRFNGKIDEVEPFLNEIEDCVYIQRFALPTDEDKCRYMGLYMADGSPVEWFANIKRNHSNLLQDFTQFVAASGKTATTIVHYVVDIAGVVLSLGPPLHSRHSQPRKFYSQAGNTQKDVLRGSNDPICQPQYTIQYLLEGSLQAKGE